MDFSLWQRWRSTGQISTCCATLVSSCLSHCLGVSSWFLHRFRTWSTWLDLVVLQVKNPSGLTVASLNYRSCCVGPLVHFRWRPLTFALHRFFFPHHNEDPIRKPSNIAKSNDDAVKRGLPDHWKNLRTFCRFVTIEISLHTYFEYFLDIVVYHIFSNNHC